MAQHARKNAKIQAVTANGLFDGEVVYLRPDGSWSEKISDAETAEDKENAKALLERGEQAERDQKVVGPYLFEVERDGDRLKPVSVREDIRTKGPTVRLDLGRQAERQPA